MSGSDDDDFLDDNTCKVCGKDDCGSLCPNISEEIAKYAVNKMGGDFFEEKSGADRLAAIKSKLESSVRYRQLCQADCSRSISGLGEVTNQDYSSWQNGGGTHEEEEEEDMGDGNGGGGDEANNSNEIVDDISSQLAKLFMELMDDDDNEDDIVQRIKNNHLTSLRHGHFEAALTEPQQAVLVLDFIRILCRSCSKKKMGRNRAMQQIRRALGHYPIGVEIPVGIESIYDLFVGEMQGLDKEREKIAGFGDIWAQAFDVCTSKDVTSYPLVGEESGQSQGNAGNESGSNASGDGSREDDSSSVDSSDDSSESSSPSSIMDEDGNHCEEEEEGDGFLSLLLSSYARVSEEGEAEEDTEDANVTNDGSRGQGSRKRKANA